MRVKLFMTADCNLNCAYCYEKGYRKQAVSNSSTLLDLSDDAAFGHVSEIVHKRMAALKDRELRVDFYGGEPMLELRKLLTLTEKITESFPLAEKSFSITTNATLLDKESAALLKNYTVSVSCDGDAMQNSHRVDLSDRPVFDKIVHGIELLNANGVDTKINMVVGAGNFRRVIDSIKYLTSLECNFFLLAIDYSDTGWNTVSDDELVEFYNSLMLFALDHYHDFKISIFEDSVIPLNQCYLTETIAIDVNGNIYPCIYFVTSTNNGKYCLGNVYDGYNRLRWEIIGELSKYLTCSEESCHSVEGNCAIGCYGMNLQHTGDIYSTSPIHCRHLRASYKSIFKYRMKVIRRYA